MPLDLPLVAYQAWWAVIGLFVGSFLNVVAARVPEVDFSVLNDRVVPVGDINGAVRALPHVHGPERDVRRFDDFGFLPGNIARPALADHKTADAMGAEIVGDHVALPIVRQSHTDHVSAFGSPGAMWGP